MAKQIRNPRLQISNAALRLFISKGIRGTTTKDIARKAGVSEGTIYNYFESKDDLAYRLFIQYMDMFRDELEESASSVREPNEKLTKMIEAFFEFARKKPEAYDYIIVGHYTELNKMPYEKKKPIDLFIEVIGEGMNKGIFQESEINLRAAHITGMITRTIMFHKNGRLNMSHDDLIEETTASALKVLASERA